MPSNEEIDVFTKKQMNIISIETFGDNGNFNSIEMDTRFIKIENKKGEAVDDDIDSEKSSP